VAAQSLDSPVLGGALLRSVNFFNGRLLTGDDLRSEQTAQQNRLQRLGRLAAEGVAYGLEVQEDASTSTPSKPTVTVAAGLALSRSGQALELPATVVLALARSAPAATSEPGALFADCQPFAPGTYTAGAGVYLLVIGPAREGEGLAPVSGLGIEPARCNVARSVETVRFRLIRLALSPAELADDAHLRNVVAYRCFAPDATAAFVRDPFGPPPVTYGLIDELRAQVLSDDEVPLAVIGWTAQRGIRFVDLWSVRRRIARRPAEGELTVFAGDRRRAEAEAMLLQFQDHLADLKFLPAATTMGATDAFGRLPPAGLVPLRRSASEPGFDLVAFFAGIPRRADPVFLEGSRLEHVLLDALALPPVDPRSGDPLRLHVLRENALTRPGRALPHPFVLFTSAHASYAADARFDLAYWDFANFAER
jgi:hypothetical protein